MRQSALLFLLVACVPQCFGQSVISVRSGLINYSEGEVLVNGQPLQRRLGTYTSLKEGSDLVTRSGRAEILLTPNAYLRLGAETGIRMVSDSLTDTRLELLGGSAVLDSSTAPAKTPITITVHDAAHEATHEATIRFLAPGRYRVDSDPSQIRVFEGEAEVEENGHKVKVKTEQLLPLSGAPIVRSFSDGSDSLLDLWSAERGMAIALNLKDAQNIGDPLTDPDPTIAGSYTYPGYVPLLTYPTTAGGIYGGGLGGGLGGGYGTMIYGPYGIYSPYSIYGRYGRSAGIYSPAFINTLRGPAVGYPSSGYTSSGYPSGLIGVRPGSAISPGAIHTFSPRPITTPHPIVVAPHPIGGGGHR
jgi:hypothetical protein